MSHVHGCLLLDADFLRSLGGMSSDQSFCWILIISSHILTTLFSVERYSNWRPIALPQVFTSRTNVAFTFRIYRPKRSLRDLILQGWERYHPDNQDFENFDQHCWPTQELPRLLSRLWLHSQVLHEAITLKRRKQCRFETRIGLLLLWQLYCSYLYLPQFFLKSMQPRRFTGTRPTWSNIKSRSSAADIKTMKNLYISLWQIDRSLRGRVLLLFRLTTVSACKWFSGKSLQSWWNLLIQMRHFFNEHVDAVRIDFVSNRV